MPSPRSSRSDAAYSREGDERNPGCGNRPDHQPVALAETLARELQSSQLIVLIRIRASQIEDALGIARHHARQRAFQIAQEARVARTISGTPPLAPTNCDA